MKVDVSGMGFICQGSLDETTSEPALKNEFTKIKASLGDQPLTVDFSNVRGANSNGIVCWLRFIEFARHPINYRGVPVWMVDQFNMIDRFFAFGSTVESMAVPYFSVEGEEVESIMMRIGTEIELRSDYRDYNLGPRQIRGKHFEMDCEPERYFQFIALKKDQFKNALQSKS